MMILISSYYKNVSSSVGNHRGKSAKSQSVTRHLLLGPLSAPPNPSTSTTRNPNCLTPPNVAIAASTATTAFTKPRIRSGCCSAQYQMIMIEARMHR